MSPNKCSQNNPILNATGTTNLTITSSGGSVIIRFGIALKGVKNKCQKVL